MHEFETYLAAAQAAARLAGKVLEEWGEKFTVSEKGPSDLVTEADVAAQRGIYDLLHGRFPSHGFLGEEGLNRAGNSEFRWVIDPLDGTSNYVHRFPYYCVSIGLEWNRELVVGVVFDPTRNEMFSAAKGLGATLNDKRIRPSRFSSLSQALVIASFPPAATCDSPAVQRFMRILPKAQAVHRSGSAALNLAYVASGRLEGFWSTSLKPWDMAAGALLVTEAGGRITRTTGQALDIEVSDLLATNGLGLHEELLSALTDTV